jgi:signal transduction histidine kinase/ActR/RegA family two-component response regulator
MNHEQVLAAVGATVGVVVALLTLGLARAPGCRGLKWLGLVTLSAGAICALRTAAEGTADDRTAATLVHLVEAMSGVLIYSWVRYEASDRDRALGRAERAMAMAAVVATVLWLVSSVAGARVLRHGDGWSRVTYVDLSQTFGAVVGLAGIAVVAALLVARYVRRWRGGERAAGAHALALGGLLATSMHDIIDAVWLHARMHLMPVGLLWAVLAVGVALIGRFVDGARTLAEMSGRLERGMAERNAELARARATLVETQGLVTLGRLSAAVAHEINNPVAVVAANVGYLRDSLGGVDAGIVASDSAEALEDTLSALDRIAAIVRQLGEAGELAMHGGTVFPVALAAAVAGAVAAASSRTDAAVPVDVAVASSFYVSSQETSLRQVIGSLVAGAIDAIVAGEGGGMVRVSAEAQGEQLVLRIADDAPVRDGILHERRFRPFFERRPDAVRGDVGLSVSLALVRMLGAEIAIERSGDVGSIVRIELRAVPAPAQRPSARMSTRAPRARVLIVDDDLLTRIGLRRLLGREYVIEEASSVEQALAIVESDGDDLDAIVCDVVMPDGGAEALLAVLEERAPTLADATLLLTGGAIDERTGAFLGKNADRLVRKPVDVATLRATLERVRIHRSGSSVPSLGRRK